MCCRREDYKWLPSLHIYHDARTDCPHLTRLPNFHLSHRQRSFNERTGTPFNYLTFPSDIVLQVVLWRLRYKLSLHDLARVVAGQAPQRVTTDEHTSYPRAIREVLIVRSLATCDSTCDTTPMTM